MGGLVDGPLETQRPGAPPLGGRRLNPPPPDPNPRPPQDLVGSLFDHLRLARQRHISGRSPGMRGGSPGAPRAARASPAPPASPAPSSPASSAAASVRSLIRSSVDSAGDFDFEGFGDEDAVNETLAQARARALRRGLPAGARWAARHTHLAHAGPAVFGLPNPGAAFAACGAVPCAAPDASLDTAAPSRPLQLLFVMERLDEKIGPMLETDGHHFNRRCAVGWGRGGAARHCCQTLGRENGNHPPPLITLPAQMGLPVARWPQRQEPAVPPDREIRWWGGGTGATQRAGPQRGAAADPHPTHLLGAAQACPRCATPQSPRPHCPLSRPDVYTSRVSNFMRYTPYAYFRPAGGRGLRGDGHSRAAGGGGGANQRPGTAFTAARLAQQRAGLMAKAHHRPPPPPPRARARRSPSQSLAHDRGLTAYYDNVLKGEDGGAGGDELDWDEGPATPAGRAAAAGGRGVRAVAAGAAGADAAQLPRDWKALASDDPADEEGRAATSGSPGSDGGGSGGSGAQTRGGGASGGSTSSRPPTAR